MSATKNVKVKKSKVDLEAERSRAEPNLSKAYELSKSLGQNWLTSVLQVSLRLEAYELDYGNVQELADCEKIISDISHHIDDKLQLEYLVLKSKCLYFRGNYNEIYKLLKPLHLLTLIIPSYSSRIPKLVSEGLALLGMAQLNSCKNEPVSSSVEMLHSAVNLAITTFQEYESCDIDTDAKASQMSVVIQEAAMKDVSIQVDQGNLLRAIRRLRSLLHFQETRYTKSLRQTLAKHLAMILLKILPPTEYQPYSPQDDNQTEINYRFRLPKTYPTGKFIPQDPNQESLLMLLLSEYIANQDVILNRSSELMDVRDKTINSTFEVYDLLVLNLVRSSSFSFLSKTLENSLKFSFEEFHIWYQYGLTLIAAKDYYRAYLVLRECQRIQPQNAGPFILSASLCFSHLRLLDEGTELISKAVEVCSTVKRVGLENVLLLGRAHLIRGWGYCLASQETKMPNRRQELQWHAIAEYRIATQLNPHDYLAWYHLALELANQRHIHEALVACQRAISLNAATTDSSVFRLLALIHSAAHHKHHFSTGNQQQQQQQQQQQETENGNNTESTTNGAVDSNAEPQQLNIPMMASVQGKRRLDLAAQAIYAGFVEHPQDFSLLFTLAKLEMMRSGPRQALTVYRKIVEQWRDMFGGQAAFASLMNSFNSSEATLVDGSADEFNMRSIDSTLHDFVSPSRLELIMSEMVLGSSTGPTFGMGFDQRLESYLLPPASLSCSPSMVSTAKNHQQHAQHQQASTGHTLAQFIQIRIYACLSELYIEMGHVKEAQEFIEEASSISKVNRHLLYIRARLLELKGRLADAKSMYESVIALAPGHMKSLLALGRLLTQTGEYALAERILQQAIAVDPKNSEAWRLLGDTLCCIKQSADEVELPYTQDAAIRRDPLSAFPLMTANPEPMVVHQANAASRAYQKAIALEQTEPLEPFYTLPIGVPCV